MQQSKIRKSIKINQLKIAKTYRTISHEALCILTGLTLITIKAEEFVTLCNITTGRKKQKYQIDKEEEQSNWLHLADIFSVNDTKDDGEEQLRHIFMEGSKSEQGVGSGVALFTGRVLTEQLKFKQTTGVLTIRLNNWLS